MPTVSAAQRRARLGRRHHLARTGKGVTAVAADLCGIHATDPASVMLALRARVAGFTVGDAEQALYEDRVLARILAMRRTMFVVPTGDVGVFHAAATRRLIPQQQRVNVRYVTDTGVAPAGRDPDTWLADVADRTVAALRRRGPSTARDLVEDVPELGIQMRVNRGKAYEATMGLSTRVLFLLATQGRVVRGRPAGTWLSSQYHWAALDAWFDGAVDVDAVDDDVARAGLARRWLQAYGPGTLADLQWWTGWNKTQTVAALAACDAVEVDLGDGRVGHLSGDDLDDVAAPEPWVALLPGLDATTMGWKEREHYLDPAHVLQLFDTNGNVGATVLVDGQVVGGWGQRPDGEVVVRLLVDVGRERTEAVEAEAAAVTAWLDGVVVSPRFPTPLARQLAAQG